MEANPRLPMSTQNPDTISSSNPLPEPPLMHSDTLYAGVDEALGSTTSTNAQQASGNSSSAQTPDVGCLTIGPQTWTWEALTETISLLNHRLDSLNSSVLRQTRELKVLRESTNRLLQWASSVGHELGRNS
jgi:hypothetical protein